MDWVNWAYSFVVSPPPPPSPQQPTEGKIINSMVIVSFDEIMNAKARLRPTKTKVYPKKYPSRDPCVAEMERLNQRRRLLNEIKEKKE